MDGGREVHAMQVALGRHGFHCGDDDMTWWMFGESTMNALRIYQVSWVGWVGGGVGTQGRGGEGGLIKGKEDNRGRQQHCRLAA